MLLSRLLLVPIALLLVAFAGCSDGPDPDAAAVSDSSSNSGESPDAVPPASASPAEDPPAAASEPSERSFADAAAALDTSALVTGQPCAEAPNAADEMVEQSAATIPLVAGLTLAFNWYGPDEGRNDFDHECLTQVAEVSAARVVLLSRCEEPNVTRTQRRTQICRNDLRSGSIYRTEFGSRVPDLISGSTMSVLSRRSFLELRDRGETRFRQVHIFASTWQTDAPAAEPDSTVYVREDVSGPLRRVGESTLPVQLNDALVNLPVIQAEARLIDGNGRVPPQQVELQVLNDERLPIVLDYHRPTTGAITKFIRITWPEQTAIERDLAEKRESTVYGIYFDYNSAEIRAESEVTLQQIAQALNAHPDWTLSIVGHTDSIGGSDFNRDLSERRAEAVRTALVEGHGIAANRLAASGAGDSRPVDTNDTPEGRTRNRRVELTRP
jgi:outer membrane protein OmpA-like peptidoglycan-associated protein